MQTHNAQSWWDGLKSKQKSKLQRQMFGVFRHLTARCSDPDNRDYAYYGARGITCHWENYEAFRDDMWESFLVHRFTHPEHRNTQIDRIDSDGDYSVVNCRWVTAKENSQNRRSNIVITLWGDDYCLTEVCEMFNIPYFRARKELRLYGWPIENVILHRSPRSKEAVT